MNIDENLIVHWATLLENEDWHEKKNYNEKFRAQQRELIKSVKPGQGILETSGSDTYGYYITDVENVKYNGQEHKALSLYSVRANGAKRDEMVDFDSSIKPNIVLFINLNIYEVLEISLQDGIVPQGILGETSHFHILKPGEKAYWSQDENFD